VELPLIPILARAKEKGIMVDKDYLAKISVDYHKQLAESEKMIFDAAGGEFNVNSPKQLSEVLFTKLNLKIKGLKKTGGGVTSTRESELLKLKDEHPIVNEILVYREIQKLLSTYIDNLPKLLDEHNRLHTTFNQAGTTTGRMSSTEPNLQNIPARGGLGAVVRNAFIAPKGTLLIGLDYSQIEMRVLAVLSKDPGLTKIFVEGEDVHTSVASLVFGVKSEEVTKEMRRKAKVINFGIIYGMGVNALRANLGSTREEAQKFYDDYFAKLPKIREYFDNCLSEARGLGYTETMFGRRRYFAGIKSKLPFVRAMAERMAMNAPIQGSAADIVKLAMIKADKVLEKAGLGEKARLLLQVHDELIFEVEEKDVEEAEKIIAEAMESVVPGKIKFTVSRASGKNWGELK
jgi:DNA polymerase-1